MLHQCHTSQPCRPYNTKGVRSALTGTHTQQRLRRTVPRSAQRILRNHSLRRRQLAVMATLGADGEDSFVAAAAADILDGEEAPQHHEHQHHHHHHHAAPAPPPAKAVKKSDWALRSVLKVFVTKVEPNYGLPWQKCPQRTSTGSAFVLDVERRRIITNAHVVQHATTVYVRRPGNAKKWKTSVTCLGKPCDLALLTVEEDAFWTDDLRPLQFVGVPELQSPIAVAGYPVGGDSLSITKGIVSRVSMVRYSQSGKLLGIQIDAAINPGNSGGPAFLDLQNGKVAGVAFSKNSSSATDNIGYIIPLDIVNHFLSEFEEHGTYRGICSPGFNTQVIENEAQQAFLKMPDGTSGCAVVKLDPASAAPSVLQVNDVILALDGIDIAGDETVQFRDDERLDYSHVVRLKHIGEQLKVDLLRKGERLSVSYELGRQQPLVGILHEVDCWPSYFVIGGLVFAPLSLPCLEAVYGPKKWRTLAPISVLSSFTAQRTDPEQQVVVLVQVLSHEVTHGYRYSVVPCETFNGTPLNNLAHLASLVDAVTQAENPEPFLNFGLEGGRFITLDTQEVALHGASILRTNGIAHDRSDDLLATAATADAATAGHATAALGNGTGPEAAASSELEPLLPQQ